MERFNFISVCSDIRAFLWLADTYTLFEGLADNTRCHFASCIVYFEPSECEEKSEQWVQFRVYCSTLFSL